MTLSDEECLRLVRMEGDKQPQGPWVGGLDRHLIGVSARIAAKIDTSTLHADGRRGPTLSTTLCFPQWGAFG